MALRHLYRDLDGTLTDMSAYAPRAEWTAQSKAEEGAVGSWTVTLDDPDSSLDIVGHRNWFIEDDASEDDDDIIFGGFTGAQTFARYEGNERRMQGPLARVITIELYDANTVLARQVMRGSDTNRPIETDVERMTWLLGTDEASILGDVSTFVDSSSPRNMDKAPLRGTYFGQIITDCAHAGGDTSGKNFFAWYRKVDGSRVLTMWYGKDSLPDYTSPLYLSNDPADIDNDAIDDGTATVWKLSDDAKLVRSPERQYCGNYATYEGGATYRHNATTHDLVSAIAHHHRDMVSNFPMIKKRTTARARADRQLLDVQHQDIRITTTLTGIPQERVTLVKAGMRIEIKGTHWGPDDDDWHYARILTAQPQPFGPGRTWDIDLELSLGAASSGPPAPPWTAKAFAGLQNSNYTHDPLGYTTTGDAPDPGWNANPTVGPLATVGSGAPYTQLRADANITVRVYALAFFSTVAISASATLTVTSSIRGILFQDVKTFSHASPGGFWSGSCLIDEHDVDLVDGEVLTVSGDIVGFLTGGWGGTGANNSSFRIGRGTHAWGSGGSAEIWVGP